MTASGTTSTIDTDRRRRSGPAQVVPAPVRCILPQLLRTYQEGRTMRVLVAYASKHGGTREIAQLIAGRIRQPDVKVELRAIGDIKEPASADAFVIGSSIYMGHWDKDAVTFVHRNHAAFAGRPFWLFSSGPVGNQERVDPVELPTLEAVVDIRDHKLFRGVLKMDRMSFAERLIAKAMKMSGDYRDWPAIEVWADQIRTELSRTVTITPA